MQQLNARFWTRAEMCGLADLAGRFVLSVYVRVARDLGNKKKKHYHQAESTQPSPVPSDLCSVNHFAFSGYPKLRFYATSVP